MLRIRRKSNAVEVCESISEQIECLSMFLPSLWSQTFHSAWIWLYVDFCFRVIGFLVNDHSYTTTFFYVVVLICIISVPLIRTTAIYIELVFFIGNVEKSIECCLTYYSQNCNLLQKTSHISFWFVLSFFAENSDPFFIHY